MTPSPRRAWIWLAFVILLLAAGVYWARTRHNNDLPTLLQAPVVRANLIQSISSTGTLSALKEVTVGSQVSGIVTKVLVDFNDHVRQGEIMAVIDPQTLQAQVDSARANVNVRRVAYQEAVRQWEEGKRLVTQHYIADSDVRVLEAAVRSTKAQLDAATVDFDKQNVQLKYANIRAPIDGVVMTRSVDPGNTVQASLQAPTLFVVASNLKQLKILANVDETQIPQITPGMKASFSVSGIEGRTFHAVVDQIRLKPTTVNNVVTYTVVLIADNPDLALFPGMTATIDFVRAQLTAVLQVPSAALRIRIPDELRAEPGVHYGSSSSAFLAHAGDAPQRKTAVWRVNTEGKAVRVPVKVLGSDLVNTAIEPLQPDSLRAGDAVVIKVDDAGSSSSRSSSSGAAAMMFGPPRGH